MTTPVPVFEPARFRYGPSSDDLSPIAWRSLGAFALATVVLHLAIAGRYGWFRDEFYYIDAGKHLSGGYVDFPLGVALLADAQRALFGPSLTAIHVFPALAGAIIIVLVGLMAREMGGGATAQRVAALAALTAPAFIGADALFTMDAFDELWWTLATFVLLHILRQRRPDDGYLWLMFGLVCGIGLLTKLTILAFGLAVFVGLFLTPARRELRSPWPYAGGVVAFLALVPYVLWNEQHDWPTLAFWHHYSHGESTLTFIVQVILLMQPLALPLWLAGLWLLFRDRLLAPFRPLGWAFLFLTALFLAGHAKSYFLVPAFPALLAAGAVAVERGAENRPRLAGVTVAALIIGGAALAPVVSPILPGKTLASVMKQPIQPVADRFGWPQLVGTVAAVYRRLPPAERSTAMILARNYGEAGAFDLLGPEYRLPRAISAQNTYYFWGTGIVPRGVVITTEFQRQELTPYFRSVSKAATVPPQDGIENEEAGKPVFVCRGLKMPWPRVWNRLKTFS